MNKIKQQLLTKKSLCLLLALALSVTLAPIPAAAKNTYKVNQYGELEKYSGSQTAVIRSDVSAIKDSAFDGVKISQFQVASGNQYYKTINGVLYTKSGKTLVRYPSLRSGSFTVPSSVTTIAPNAFDNCYNLTSVSMGNNVVSMGSCFYNCTKLKSVTLSDNITSIKTDCFSGCKELTSVHMPSKLTIIDEDAFERCVKLPYIKLPSKLSQIDDSAFYGCSSLSGISFPSSLKSIGYSSFAYCTSIKSITFPSNLKFLGSNAFKECTSLEKVNLKNYYKIPYDCFYNCTKLTTVTGSNSLSDIDTHAFSGCKKLANIKLPASLTYIGRGAFLDCKELGNVRLGAKLNTIGDCAFGGAATNITVASGNKKYSSTNGLLMNKDKTTVIQVPGNKRGALKIPDGVVKCQKKALYHSHISSITLPDSMTKCDAYLFDNCIKLMDINLPATLTKLNMGSWFTSDYLSSDNISSINIPKSNTVYASHDGVLYTKDKKKMLFYPVNKRGTLKLPKELKNLNRNLNTNRLTDIKIPNSNTKFTTKNGLLFDKKVQYLKRVPLKRTEITLPATVKSAGYLENIQSTCNLKSVKVAKMNKNYYSIDGVLFDDYHNTLTFYPPKKSGAYVIPESTRYIDDTAFQYANQLTSLTISKNVKRSSYNIYQFTNCSKLKTVIVKQGKLNTIKMRFRNCDALRTIDLPSSIMNMEIKGLNRNITIKGWSNTNAPDIAKKAKCKFVSKGSAPSMVGNIKIKKIVDKYEISWTPADSADGYQVYTRYETIATVKGRNTTKCVVKDIYDYYEYSSPKIYVRAYKNNGKTKTYGKARSYKMKEKY